MICSEVNKVNLFDQYGIKEVADVTIYSIHKKQDSSGELYYVPALYLDTLKITTTEKTAENTWAQGGLGNSRLVGWDYGKTINLTLEDALCTPASLGLCWGGILGSDWKDAQINHSYGIKDLTNCGTERISRMEKAFYPRNDSVNGVISNLLPRDGKEDVFLDQGGDPVYLQRSSVLDGTDVRGFGYVKTHPYKWRLEIETAVKSVAVVPDRFFSIYGKSYPIKRQQTVGINQPSESFKYEIIYLRGYDKYDDEKPQARIIYHKQMEDNIIHEYTCEEDKEALKLLDDFDGYPYLKIRVCYDGSIKAFLGSRNVDWDQERQINDTAASPDTAWVEIPQIDTSQFYGIEMWLRFESINALSYYLITKYEENIFAIGPKVIQSPLQYTSWYVMRGDNKKLTGTITAPDGASTEDITINIWVQHGDSEWEVSKQATNSITVNNLVVNGEYYAEWNDNVSTGQLGLYVLKQTQGKNDFIILSQSGGPSGASTRYGYDINELIEKNYLLTVNAASEVKMERKYHAQASVDTAVGNVYSLDDPAWTSDTTGCVPCCKRDNLSRSIWAYVNPKTMTPYDDDYWFHQGEHYYKKSLTLSTKERPLKAKRIFVNAGTFPGMYKIVGETYIRSRETGEDERVQLSFPLCKIMSNQTLTLQADGDPTTFNLEVEVATPENGNQMEITFYEVEKDMKKSCCGQSMVEKDGSTRIVAGD